VTVPTVFCVLLCVPPAYTQKFFQCQRLPCSVCFCVYLPRIHRSFLSDQCQPCFVLLCVPPAYTQEFFSDQRLPCPVVSCCCTQEFPVPTVSCRVVLLHTGVYSAHRVLSSRAGVHNSFQCPLCPVECYCFKALPESRVNFLSVPNIRLPCQRVFGE